MPYLQASAAGTTETNDTIGTMKLRLDCMTREASYAVKTVVPGPGVPFLLSVLVSLLEVRFDYSWLEKELTTSSQTPRSTTVALIRTRHGQHSTPLDNSLLPPVT
jgi:hypothetical protein